MEPDKLKQIVEAALLAADEPLTVDQLVKLFRAGEVDDDTIRNDLRDALNALEAEAEGRGYELKRVASGFRYQVRQELSAWISRLWEEKPPRYTRALLETLALVAYKQPVTRGDIEQVRGVSVSQSIMRTLLERGWIRVVGQREVPGRPSMYGTTRAFLDYFDLKSLDQLPPLAEIRELIEPVFVEEEEQLVVEEAAAEQAAAEQSTEPIDPEDNRSAEALFAVAAEREAESQQEGFEAEVDAALAAADAITARFNDAANAAKEAEAAAMAAADAAMEDPDDGADVRDDAAHGHSQARVVDVSGLDETGTGDDGSATGGTADAETADQAGTDTSGDNVVQLPTAPHGQ